MKLKRRRSSNGLKIYSSKLTKKTKPDPGRVTARRLNRVEYANTVRDLLGIDFRATQEFPVDDSGDGFDNIADVLTISPVLMEKYMTAAERIAARAVGADPLPKKPLEFEYSRKNMNLRRLNPSAVEATHRVDWDGEYIIRFGLPGERSADAKPVTMGFWMDGKLLNTIQVETKPSKLVYFDPYSEEEMRLFLPEGDHVFPRRIHQRRVRQEASRRGTPTTTRRTSSSARCSSSGLSRPRPRRRAGRRY